MTFSSAYNFQNPGGLRNQFTDGLLTMGAGPFLTGRFTDRRVRTPYRTLRGEDTSAINHYMFTHGLLTMGGAMTQVSIAGKDTSFIMKTWFSK